MSALLSNQKVNVPGFLPIAIWTVVLLSIISRTVQIDANVGDANVGNIVSRTLRYPLLQFLGRISYSIYLIHQLVIFIFLLFAGSLILKLQPAVAFLLESVILIPITLALAYAANVFVERPFISLGRKLTPKAL